MDPCLRKLQPSKTRLRAACNNCHRAKVRCSGQKTGCARCGLHHLECTYSEFRVGKSNGSRRRKARSPDGDVQRMGVNSSASTSTSNENNYFPTPSPVMVTPTLQSPTPSNSSLVPTSGPSCYEDMAFGTSSLKDRDGDYHFQNSIGSCSVVFEFEELLENLDDACQQNPSGSKFTRGEALSPIMETLYRDWNPPPESSELSLGATNFVADNISRHQDNNSSSSSRRSSHVSGEDTGTTSDPLVNPNTLSRAGSCCPTTSSTNTARSPHQNHHLQFLPPHTNNNAPHNNAPSLMSLEDNEHAIALSLKLVDSIQQHLVGTPEKRDLVLAIIKDTNLEVSNVLNNAACAKSYICVTILGITLRQIFTLFRHACCGLLDDTVNLQTHVASFSFFGAYKLEEQETRKIFIQIAMKEVRRTIGLTQKLRACLQKISTGAPAGERVGVGVGSGHGEGTYEALLDSLAVSFQSMLVAMKKAIGEEDF